MGEEAVDYGGVRKELFNLCISQFIRNMKRCGDGTMVWFSDFTPFDDVEPPEDSEERRELEEYIEELKATKNSSFYLGVLVSLACYNGKFNLYLTSSF